MSKPIARHSDGSNCYTVGCSLGHVSNALQAARSNDVAGYLKARDLENQQKTVKVSPQTHRALEYGTENYNLFVKKSDELTAVVDGKEVQSVVEYTGWAYKQYYSFLEGKNKDGSEFGSEYDDATKAQLTRAVGAGVARIDSLISKAGKLPKPVAVYRGEKVPAGVSITEHLSKKFPIGEKINIKRFLSTSLDPKIASEITGEDTSSSYVLVIKTKEGAMLGEYTSEHGLREKEVLLPRDKSYKVERIASDVIQWGNTRRTHATVYLTME